MDVIEHVDEDAVLMAWAEAERESIEQRTGSPFPESPTRDEARAGLEASRGYPDGVMFKGWPKDVAWKRAIATVAEIGEFLHCGYWTFREVTKESRLPRDAAANIDAIQTGDELNKIVPEIAAAIRDGSRFPPLIAVAEDEDSQPILAEGNKRAIAYQLALPPDEKIEILFGTSPDITGWVFF